MQVKKKKDVRSLRAVEHFVTPRVVSKHGEAPRFFYVPSILHELPEEMIRIKSKKEVEACFEIAMLVFAECYVSS